jgi:pyruvyl transferase EpsO
MLSPIKSAQQFDKANSVIDRLSDAINETLGEFVDPSLPFSLLDFPHYDNIGDSAIYLGELAYFDSRGMRAAYVSTNNDFDAASMDEAIGDGAIYLQGGGNFGDLWPWFQPFRESILERYKGRPVVQLPQTIHYASQERIDQTARIIEKHGAFVLLVRDKPSYDLATRHFQCEIRLCPDMAFCIGKVQGPTPSHELLLHLRKDKEATGSHDTAALAHNPNVVIADWPRERRRHFVDLRGKLTTVLGGSVFKGQNAFREAYFRNLANMRFRTGVSLLGSAKAVVTDRLHGHIISTLMELPHAVLDNSYGKTSNFSAAWSTISGKSHLATNLAEAVEVLRAQEHLKLDAD